MKEDVGPRRPGFGAGRFSNSPTASYPIAPTAPPMKAGMSGGSAGFKPFMRVLSAMRGPSGAASSRFFPSAGA